MESTQFPGATDFLENISIPPKFPAIHLANIFETAINYMEMALQIFIVCTIRCSEDIIINEPEPHKKNINKNGVSP